VVGGVRGETRGVGAPRDALLGVCRQPSGSPSGTGDGHFASRRGRTGGPILAPRKLRSVLLTPSTGDRRSPSVQRATRARNLSKALVCVTRSRRLVLVSLVSGPACTRPCWLLVGRSRPRCRDRSRTCIVFTERRAAGRNTVSSQAEDSGPRRTLRRHAHLTPAN
jgi:hypothetical protein